MHLVAALGAGARVLRRRRPPLYPWQRPMNPQRSPSHTCRGRPSHRPLARATPRPRASSSARASIAASSHRGSLSRHEVTPRAVDERGAPCNPLNAYTWLTPMPPPRPREAGAADHSGRLVGLEENRPVTAAAVQHPPGHCCTGSCTTDVARHTSLSKHVKPQTNRPKLQREPLRLSLRHHAGVDHVEPQVDGQSPRIRAWHRGIAHPGERTLPSILKSVLNCHEWPRRHRPSGQGRKNGPEDLVAWVVEWQPCHGNQRLR